MIFRRPIGVYSRNTPDFFWDKLATAGATVKPSVGNYSYISLYNNSQTGLRFFIYGFWVRNLGTSSCPLSWASGLQGSGPVAAQSVAINQFTPPGQITSLYSASQLGTSYSEVGVANGSYSWPYEWPIAILPPGYSLLARSGDFNQWLLVRFWYYVAAF